MGWILALLMSAIAAVAIAAIWRRYQRDVAALESSREKVRRQLDEEHRRIKRLEREYERNLLAAHHPLAADLLPALDSLDEALTHFEGLRGGEKNRVSDLEEGLVLARRALDDALGRHGITTIDPKRGDLFDPTVHEAIASSEDEELEPGTICRLLRRGYRDEDLVLRAALVEVNIRPSQDSSASDEPDASSGGTGMIDVGDEGDKDVDFDGGGTDSSSPPPTELIDDVTKPVVPSGSASD